MDIDTEVRMTRSEWETLVANEMLEEFLKTRSRMIEIEKRRFPESKIRARIKEVRDRDQADIDRLNTIGK